MKILNHKYKTTIIYTIILLLIGCEETNVVKPAYIDPHIIFTSRRWWNYDIYISDIYGSKITHLTKNKWIDFNPSISLNGEKIAFVSERDGNREIYIANLKWMDGYTQWTANNLINLTNSKENDWTPTFSPVEGRIAFATYFPKNDNYDIFIMNDDGTGKENLTNTSSYEKFPQFSPDGSFIIYQGWQRGMMDIFFTNILDKNRINLTKSIKSNDIVSHGNAFSPDGQSIVFTSDRDGNRNIYLMKIDGSEIEKLTKHESNDYEPTFSPDGESIVFTSERDGNKEIYIIFLETKKIKNLTNNSGDDWNPRFHSDNQKIVFQSTRDGNWEIYIMNLNGEKQINISNHSSTDYSFAILPLINP